MMSASSVPQSNAKRYWGEEKNIDSIYSIYLKKICYSHNNDVSLSTKHHYDEHRCSQDGSHSSNASTNDLARFASQHSNDSCQIESPKRGRKNFFQKYRRRSCSMDKYSLDKYQKGSSTLAGTPDSGSSTQSSLQWETRQIRILQAATLDHVLKFILLINSPKDLNNINSTLSSDKSSTSSVNDDASLEEERNNVAHIIHVLFCTYRIYTNPYELMLKLMDYSDICRIEQYRFVMHYWMENYPEDFDYTVENPENCEEQKESSVRTVASELLRLCRDEYIRKKAIRLTELRAINMAAPNNPDSDTSRRSRQSHANGSSKNSAILDLDSRYIAQQITAIDLDNFLNLRIYSLLEGTRSDKRVQSMIKNFNLLSRHVVVTILRSHNPSIVTAHWIAIAMNLRKIKNFNSLKAIIAGLTNESIYRLKQLIWNKLDRTSLANFKLMSSIVDDVNNQIVLRQTQLVVEGTAKMSIEDDSFGTIPYLGTFLTDLNMIDARYPTYVPSPKDETSKLKLINFEKCAKQFEILTQVQLLQKNVLASLHALQRRNHFDEQTTLNRLRLEFNQSHQALPAAKPAIPKVSRLFENWFYDNNVASMTDKQW
jgi:ral guanine nucleotide dissociation stimulator-like 1